MPTGTIVQHKGKLYNNYSTTNRKIVKND